MTETPPHFGKWAGQEWVPTSPLPHNILSWVGQRTGVPILQIRKLRLTEVRRLYSEHMASKKARTMPSDC